MGQGVGTLGEGGGHSSAYHAASVPCEGSQSDFTKERLRAVSTLQALSSIVNSHYCPSPPVLGNHSDNQRSGEPLSRTYTQLLDTLWKSFPEHHLAARTLYSEDFSEIPVWVALSRTQVGRRDGW